MPVQIATLDDVEAIIRRFLVDTEAMLRRVIREEQGDRAPSMDSLTTAQAAVVAGVSPKTILSWINAGLAGRKLEANRRGKLRVVKRSDLESYLAGEQNLDANAEQLLRRLQNDRYVPRKVSKRRGNASDVRPHRKER